MVKNNSFKKNRKRSQYLAAVSGMSIAAIVMSLGTTALWKDNVNLDGGQIVSGNLDVEPINSLQWSDISKELSTPRENINLSTYRLIPGSTLLGEQQLDVGLEGDNLRAKILISTQDPEGTLPSDHHGVNVKYRMVDNDGEEVVKWTPLGEDSTEVNLLPGMVSGKVVDTVKDFTIQLKVDFDADTPMRERTEALAHLGYIRTTLRQVRGPETEKSVLTLHKLATIIEDSKDIGVINYGDKVEYTYKVKNTGFVKASQVTINDELTKKPGVTITPSEPQDIDPGKTILYKIVYTPTADDLAHPQKVLNVKATASDANSTESNEDNATLPTKPIKNELKITQNATFTYDKYTVDSADPGDKIEYSYTVTNNGEYEVKNVTVTDPLLEAAGVLPKTVPAIGAGESVTVKATLNVDNDLVSAGSIKTRATVAGVATVCASDACNLSASTTEMIIPATAFENNVSFTGEQKLSYDKNGDGQLGLGDTIQYFYTVKNLGTTDSVVDITSNFFENKNVTVTVSDENTKMMRGAKTSTDMLTPGQSRTYVATFTPKADDLASPTSTVDAKVTLKSVECVTGNNCVSSKDYNMVTNNVIPSGAATVTSSTGQIVAPDNFEVGTVDPGEQIKYTITVKNTGELSLLNSSITGTLNNGEKVVFTSTDEGNLAPDATRTFTATYTPANSYTSGSITLTPTYTAVTAGNQSITAAGSDIVFKTNPVTTTVTAAASGSLNPDSYTINKIDPNDTVNYTIKITNTANLPYESINVDDVNYNGSTIKFVSNESGALNPGATRTFTGSFKPTNSDLTSGSLTITPKATYNIAGETYSQAANPVVFDTVPVVNKAQISSTQSLTTDVNSDGKLGVGDTIKYVWTVKNEGTQPSLPVFTSTYVTDKGLTVTPNKTGLMEPGETRTYTASYTPTADQLVYGDYNVDGKIVLTYDQCATVSPCEATSSTTISTLTAQPVSAIQVTSSTGKINSPDNFVTGTVDPGDTVTYTVTVKNSGQTTLKTVNISDAYLNSKNIQYTSQASGNLLPGESRTYTATFAPANSMLGSPIIVTPTVTGTNLNNVNTVQVTGTTVTFNSIAPKPDGTVTSTSIINPDGYTTNKVDYGDTLNYNVTVKNTGNVNSNVTVSNITLFGRTVTFTSTETGELAPGASRIFTGSFTPTVTDLSTGTISVTPAATLTATNCATNCVANITGNTVTNTSTPVTTSMTVTGTSTIVSDSGTVGKINPGDTVRYTYTVKNTSNVNITNVTFTAPGSTMTPSNVPMLAPNETAVFTSNTITPPNTAINGSNLTYTGSASATAVSGGTVNASGDATVATDAITSSMSLTISQTISPDTGTAGSLDVNDVVKYTQTVKNTGNTTLSNVTPSSNRAITWSPTSFATLAPGATTTFTGNLTATSAMVTGSPVYTDHTVTAQPNICSTTGTCPAATKTTQSITNTSIQSTTAGAWPNVGYTVNVAANTITLNWKQGPYASHEYWYIYQCTQGSVCDGKNPINNTAYYTMIQNHILINQTSGVYYYTLPYVKGYRYNITQCNGSTTPSAAANTIIVP